MKAVWDYLTVEWLHVLSSAVLFGTGLASAFYVFFTNRTRDVGAIAVVVRRAVIADWLSTTPTAIIRPATGFYLVYLAGLPLSATWLWVSIALGHAPCCAGARESERYRARGARCRHGVPRRG